MNRAINSLDCSRGSLMARWIALLEDSNYKIQFANYPQSFVYMFVYFFLAQKF